MYCVIPQLFGLICDNMSCICLHISSLCTPVDGFSDQKHAVWFCCNTVVWQYNGCLTMLISGIVMHLLELKTKKIHSRNNFNFTQALLDVSTYKIHHQEVSFRIQALWCNVMSKYVWCYGVWSVCIVQYIGWFRYTEVKAILWI